MQLFRHDHCPLSEENQRPLLDRNDIHARVQAARERQLERFKGTRLTCNAELCLKEVREFCQTGASGLKLALTIADLPGSDVIAANHVAEAVQYRPRVGV
jgi:magnesium chelatase family protein